MDEICRQLCPKCVAHGSASQKLSDVPSLPVRMTIRFRVKLEEKMSVDDLAREEIYGAWWTEWSSGGNAERRGVGGDSVWDDGENYGTPPCPLSEVPVFLKRFISFSVAINCRCP